MEWDRNVIGYSVVQTAIMFEGNHKGNKIMFIFSLSERVVVS